MRLAASKPPVTRSIASDGEARLLGEARRISGGETGFPSPKSSVISCSCGQLGFFAEQFVWCCCGVTRAELSQASEGGNIRSDTGRPLVGCSKAAEIQVDKGGVMALPGLLGNRQFPKFSESGPFDGKADIVPRAEADDAHEEIDEGSLLLVS